MHVWNVLHAARCKYRTQKIAILAPSHNFVGLYLCSWGMYRQSEKNLLNSNTSCTCPHNMVNVGLLTAEICLGLPCKFQWLSRLDSITARHSSTGRQPNFAALNRGCHVYLAGRPSRWALAHILVTVFISLRCFSQHYLHHYYNIHSICWSHCQWSRSVFWYIYKCLQCFDAVGWAAGRASGL